MNICNLNVNLNPCTRIAHSNNARVLQSVLDCFCELSSIDQNHYFSVFATPRPDPYNEPEGPPAQAVQPNALLIEQHSDYLSYWVFRSGTQTWDLEASIPLGGSGFAPNTTYCVTDLDEFAGATFLEKLNNAIAFLGDFGKLDLTNQGDKVLTNTLIIPKPLTILWPASTINYTGPAGTDMISIQSNNVSLIGVARSPKRTELGPVSVFDMQIGRYHIHSRGFGNILVENFDFLGEESVETENESGVGLNVTGQLSGHGGLYFEKADPGTTSGGNNVNNLFINNVYIQDCYAHGVYVDTPILSKMFNVRVSGARGHGIYINGGTSTILENCFCAKAFQAGICVDGAAYSAIINGASENAGVGYWLRSVQGISVFSSGSESCRNAGADIIPVDLTTLAGDNSTVVNIDDIGSDFEDDFRGTSWLISGGRSIVLNAPFSTNVGQPHPTKGTTNNSRHFHIKGNSRGVTILNPRLNINSGSPVVNRFDWEFEQLGADAPSDMSIYYDPDDGTITPLIASYFTSINNATESTYVRTDTDDFIFYAGLQWFTSQASPTIQVGSHPGAFQTIQLV